jgi:hypothetical protein
MSRGKALDMTEPANRPEGQTDRRRAPRAALRLSATMREPGRGRVGVRLIDISTHGCRIEATSGAGTDTWLWLSIAGLETQYCRVVWHCHEFAGLEFATPLAEAVLERLLQDQQTLSEAAVGELRDIANRTHRLSLKQADADPVLAELSHKCAVEAVVEGFRLSEASRGDSAGAPKRGSR